MFSVLGIQKTQNLSEISLCVSDTVVLELKWPAPPSSSRDIGAALFVAQFLTGLNATSPMAWHVTAGCLPQR